MLALYHMPMAICAQKVRVCLAEKGVLWESRPVAGPALRSPEYLRMNPGGYVPTLVHEDRIVTESRIICEYVNEAFDGPALMPEDAYERARAGLWTKQIDDSLHLNVFTLSCVLMFRPALLKRTPEELEAHLPLDITKRERTRDLIAKGEGSHYVAVALQRFAKLIDDMERTLQQSRWLACDRYTLADVDYTPYLQRLTDLGLENLWAERQAVQDWWTRVRARPSFAEVQSNWMKPEELDGLAAGRARGTEMFGPLLQAA